MLRKKVGNGGTVAVALACAWCLWACASGSARIGDRYFDEGRYVEAAAAYESYLDEEVSNRADEALTRFRLGLIYARAFEPTFDPIRAAALLERSLELKPESDYELQARVVLDLSRNVVSLRSQVEARKGRVETLFAEITAMQERIERAEGQAGKREIEVESLSKQIAKLRSEIGTLMSQVEEKEQELERLKAIDLDPEL